MFELLHTLTKPTQWEAFYNVACRFLVDTTVVSLFIKSEKATLSGFRLHLTFSVQGKICMSDISKSSSIIFQNMFSLHTLVITTVEWIVSKAEHSNFGSVSDVYYISYIIPTLTNAN